MTSGQGLKELGFGPNVVPFLKALGALEGAHEVRIEMIVVLWRGICKQRNLHLMVQLKANQIAHTWSHSSSQECENVALKLLPYPVLAALGILLWRLHMLHDVVHVAQILGAQHQLTPELRIVGIQIGRLDVHQDVSQLTFLLEKHVGGADDIGEHHGIAEQVHVR